MERINSSQSWKSSVRRLFASSLSAINRLSVFVMTTNHKTKVFRLHTVIKWWRNVRVAGILSVFANTCSCLSFSLVFNKRLHLNEIQHLIREFVKYCLANKRTEQISWQQVADHQHQSPCCHRTASIFVELPSLLAWTGKRLDYKLLFQGSWRVYRWVRFVKLNGPCIDLPGYPAQSQG